MSRYENTDWYYLNSFLKYRFLDLFKTPKIKIVRFKDLSKISFKAKNSLELQSKGHTVSPKINGKQQTKPIDFKECYIYNLEAIYINSQSTSFLSSDKNTLFYEQFDREKTFQYQSKVIKKHNREYAKITVFPDDFSIKKGIFFGGTFCWNYYHFLIEIVPKIKYLETLHENIKDYPILLDKSVEQIASFMEIKNIFFRDYTFIFLNPEKLYFIEDLWYITYPNTSPFNIEPNKKYLADYTKTRPDSIQYLRDQVFSAYLKPEITAVEKVFISRKSAARKYNQEEIFAVAEKYGFKEVYFENLIFSEQVFIMQNAKYIVGATGAAWTNLVFSEKNTKGLIWMSDIWGDLSVFSNLANVVGFDLNYFIYKNNSADPHNDFYLNPVTFEEQIKILIT